MPVAFINIPKTHRQSEMTGEIFKKMQKGFAALSSVRTRYQP